MCGIVGAIAQRDVDPILVEGLRRLEYRGYDSAGVAVVGTDGTLRRVRTPGKVAELAARLAGEPLHAPLGIAHTRWATHGAPSTVNAHPHVSGDNVAVVHNGIVENHRRLRERLEAAGYSFASETDSEVIAHLIAFHLHAAGSLRSAVAAAVAEMEGAFALGVIAASDPGVLVAARRGSPLVIGIGLGEHFIASDVQALLPVTQRFVHLQEGEVAELSRAHWQIWDEQGQPVSREPEPASSLPGRADKGSHRHFMQKEIFEQPAALADTIEGRVDPARVLDAALFRDAEALFEGVRGVHLVACGTSYHAALVARHWLEGLAGLPTVVEVASEYRYRPLPVAPGTLFVTLSQSGETADTLAALRAAKGRRAYRGILCICNVAQSSLVRESDLALLTRAGPEIGVASTKAFTTQLAALMLLVLALGRSQGLAAEREAAAVAELWQLAGAVEQALQQDAAIAALAERFVERQHALFLGRGIQYPIAMEGALKLKEITYIHAEAYPAGELKHGPLALIDGEMPVVAVAPADDTLHKLRSNLREVRARGGQLFVIGGPELDLEGEAAALIRLPTPLSLLAPVVFTIPLQLLAYHVAVLRGTDVDQPRNLAKSVTVE